MSPNPQRIAPSPIVEWSKGRVHHREDVLAGEEPLEIRLGFTPLTVTMRTPGDDLELAAGLLYSEGIIHRAEDLASLRHAGTDGTDQTENVVWVDLAPGVQYDPANTQRTFASTSSCGLCGKTTIDSIRARGARRLNGNFRVSPELLCRLPESLRAEQAVFERTGGLHAAAIFDAQGQLQAVREDIGRHNAVDKIVGWALLEGKLPLHEHVLLVSGRGGFEIIQKAVVAGIPVVASISAASTLAVDLAREMGLTLIGFLRGERFVIYSGGERLAK